MGVIIWKVFTYDVVKYIGPAPGYPQFLMLTSKSINSTSIDSITTIQVFIIQLRCVPFFRRVNTLTKIHLTID